MNSRYLSLGACGLILALPLVGADAPPREAIVAPGAAAAIDLSKLTATPGKPALANPAPANPVAKLHDGVNVISKAKKPPLPPSGVWKWTTFNRSMQPIENILTLSVDKKGKVTGKLVDRTGEHEIKNITLGDGTASFDVKYHSHGVGDFAHTFTVNLDPDDPSVAVEEPDFSPVGKANGGKRHHEAKAKHDPSS